MRLLYVFLPLALILCSVSLKAQLTWQFVNELPDGNAVEVNAVEADVPRSCIYIAGSCVGDMSSVFTAGQNGTPDFAVSYGLKDGFVAKYLEDGTFVWAFRIGGAGDDVVNDIAVDSNGDIYITGGFTTSIDFKGTETTPSVNSLLTSSNLKTNLFLSGIKFVSFNDSISKILVVVSSICASNIFTPFP